MPLSFETDDRALAPGRLGADRSLVSLVPLLFLLLTFGRLVTHPSALLVAADRPTVDRARVVDAPPGNDLTRQFLPLHRWVGGEWRRTGRLPTWDDRGFGGRPLIGNPQAGLGYPPTWLAWLDPAPATLGWITLGHLVWALTGMHRLGRTLGLGGAGRMVAAGSFALNPYVLAHVFEGHYPHVWAVAWYPWAADAWHRIERGERRAGLQLVATLAASALVGHPQEGYYLIIAGGLWGATGVLSRWWRRESGPGSRPGPPVRRLAMVGGLLALLLALTAVETLPAQRVAAFGLRSERPSSREAGQYHPTILNAVQLLGTDALGGPHDYFGPDNYWETLLGVGLVPLTLAGVGAVSRSVRRRARNWTILVLGSTLFAFGRQGGLFALLFEVVPGMDRFRVPARSLFLAGLGVAVLAGFGVDALTRGAPDRGESPSRRDDWWRWLRRWGIGLILLAVAIGWGVARTRGRRLTAEGLAPTVKAVVGREVRPGGGADRDRVALALARLTTDPVFGLAAGGLTLGLVLGGAWPSGRRRVGWGLGVLALAELGGSGFRLLQTAPPSAFLEPGPVARALAKACPSRPDQPRPVVRADAGVVSDLEALDLGLAKTDINDAFQIDRAAHLYGHLYELSRPRPADRDHPAQGPSVDTQQGRQRAILARLGVAGLAADQATPRTLALIRALGWPTEPVPAGSPNQAAIVARSPDPLPWAYVVPEARAVVGTDEAVIAEFAATDPRTAVLMADDPLAAVGLDRPRQGGRAADRVATDGADRVEIEVTTDAPGLLVVRQTWLPGWSASVDGQPVPIQRGNVAQQVIPLPEAGRHQVRLRYDPPGFLPGAVLSVGGLITWLALWHHRRPRPSATESTPASDRGTHSPGRR